MALEEEVSRATEELQKSNEELREEIQERKRIQGLLLDREEELQALNLTLEDRFRQWTFELEVLNEFMQQIGYSINYDEFLGPASPPWPCRSLRGRRHPTPAGRGIRCFHTSQETSYRRGTRRGRSGAGFELSELGRFSG